MTRPATDIELKIAASSAYLSIWQRQQREVPEFLPPLREEYEDDKLRRDFLDGVAMMLAPRKKSVEGPKNVTATALVYSQQHIDVYLAKNDGPQPKDRAFLDKLERFCDDGSQHTSEPQAGSAFWHDMRNFWDERLGYYVKEACKSWTTMLGDNYMTPQQKKDDKSRRRNNKSKREIGHASVVAVEQSNEQDQDERRDRVSLETICNSEDVGRFTQVDHEDDKPTEPPIRNQVETALEKYRMDITIVKEDWESVQKLIGCLRHHRESYHGSRTNQGSTTFVSSLPHSVFLDFGKFANRANKMQYPSFRAPGLQYPSGSQAQSEERANDPQKKFCRIVKHLEMLGSLNSIWRSLVRFKRRYPDLTIRFQFIPGPPATYAISKNDLLDVFNTIQGEPDFELSKAVLEKDEKPNLIGCFHCELQLLNYFSQNPTLEVYPYFGCSKLSCYLCWEILKQQPQALENSDPFGLEWDNEKRNRPFTTRGSHFTIPSRPCAFTFAAELPELEWTSKALKKLHKRLREQFEPHRAGKKNWFTDITGVSQTQALDVSDQPDRKSSWWDDDIVIPAPHQVIDESFSYSYSFTQYNGDSSLQCVFQDPRTKDYRYFIGFDAANYQGNSTLMRTMTEKLSEASVDGYDPTVIAGIL